MGEVSGGKKGKGDGSGLSTYRAKYLIDETDNVRECRLRLVGSMQSEVGNKKMKEKE